VYAAIIFVVAMLDIQTDFSLIILLILLAFIASATQDIATDAMAARAFERKDSSLLNSIQSMGSFTGSMGWRGFSASAVSPDGLVEDASLGCRFCADCIDSFSHQ